MSRFTVDNSGGPGRFWLRDNTNGVGIALSAEEAATVAAILTSASLLKSNGFEWWSDEVVPPATGTNARLREENERLRKERDVLESNLNDTNLRHHAVVKERDCFRSQRDKAEARVKELEAEARQRAMMQAETRAAIVTDACASCPLTNLRDALRKATER